MDITATITSAAACAYADDAYTGVSREVGGREKLGEPTHTNSTYLSHV